MERGIRLIGNGQAPVHLYWEELLKKIQDGSIEPLKMVSHRVLLEEMEELYKRYDAREEGIQKVFVQTKFSNPPAEGAPQLTKFGTA
jgi:threonine dehydrogenase-like Zn-dependent dehydrogenase